MMNVKRILMIISVLWATNGIAQTYNNYWINYNSVYYKFKIGNDGIYRINQGLLNQVGLGSVPVEQLQLWRNGEEQVLFTSRASGVLAPGEYLEFWGQKNDGKKDTRLYRDASYQLSDQYSLLTDSATYFLTVNTSGNNLRYTNTANNVSGNTLAPEPYFMNIRGEYFKNKINPGYGYPAGLYVYSSSYDMGEGWMSNDIYPNRPLAVQINDLNLYTAGPAASVNFGMAGGAFNPRGVRVKFGNTVILDETMSYFNIIKKEIPNVPLSLFNNASWVRITLENGSTAPEDRMLASHVEIKYPSRWNFNNKDNFYFELPASATGNYLEIENFNSGGTAPVLLDMTDRKRYVADIVSTPGKIKFVLPASGPALRKFRLVSQGIAVNVATLEQRSFINYGDAANQGDYLIISNKALYKSVNGINPVEQYRQYRASAAGGNFKAITADIDQLTDQFAFGIKHHPAAIKDFILYAKSKFSVTPRYALIIGKGITYDEYVKNIGSQYAEKLNLVPTFGSPASDVLLSSPYGSIVPEVPIGRISAVSGEEVLHYLDKMKEFESVQQSGIQTLAAKKWMKNVVQIVGGKDNDESDVFRRYMNQYKNILSDTAFGGHVELFSKTSNSAVQLISSQRIENLFEEGIGLIAYFGHSSANTLEYNLNDPSSYNNPGKYPFFLVSGCTAGNNYIFDTLRILQNSRSISESFVLSPQRGSIAMLASTHYGIAPYLDEFNTQFYNQVSVENYGGGIGDFIKTSIKRLGGDQPGIYFPSRADMEEMALHGDPAVKLYAHARPDYVLEDQDIRINPSFISVSEEKFVLEARAYNIGKAVGDSISFQVKRTYPSGNTEVIQQKRIAGIDYSDSIRMVIPIISTRDKGLNKISISIDALNEVTEISESNNTIIKEIYIYEDEARPASPANFAIINEANRKLLASTANPLNEARDYVMEMDTTILFNSPLKLSRSVNAKGGVIEFDPGITYANNTVYYWRVAVKPASGQPQDFHWNNASFVYLANSSAGSNQSHFYQHLSSDTQNIHLDSTRVWQYSSVTNIIQAKNGVFPTAAKNASDFAANINGADFVNSVCGISGIIFNVLDPVSMKPWLNNAQGAGRFGSDPVCGVSRLANFQFNLLDANKRKAAMLFLRDSIPDNYIVIARNISGTVPSTNTYATDWAADSASTGAGNTLYHQLKSQGFVLIDSFYRPRSFIFMYQKNNPEFESDFVFSNDVYDAIELSHQFVAPDTVGTITSPVFGPATNWKEFHWRGTSLESNSPDNPTVQIIGVDKQGNSTSLLKVDKSHQDMDISGIDAARYPFIQLKMRNIDSVRMSPYQLDYWRLNYLPSPEGALTPNLYFKSKDTLEQGETLQFGVAFKNISTPSFDSIKVKLQVIDKDNITHTLPVQRLKPLISGDTIRFEYSIDTKSFAGANTLFINFNPDQDQPEQYVYNNFLYTNFYVKADQFNPLLDVTFDGVHILNRDIVSARPHILIRLKDESKHLALADTALLKVQVLYPDGTLRNFHFDNDTMRFIPASLAGGDNTAMIDFSPQFFGEDDEYELIVSGKDVVGNKAGQLDYHVKFRVISKPMISNLLNYPNPFTTSTAFVFTVTGSQVPQNMRIQILTITGKVIREITTEELGPLHIGRNITDFRWDGTDMYGQKVANGVYLYRVLTNLNGKSLEKFKDDGDNTDEYFTKGYGKMYLMR